MSRASLCICAVLLLFVAALPRGAAADACDDSYLLDAAQPSPSSQLTVAQINAILKAHNDERRIVSPPAKTMPMLRWKQELADFAREYMGTCVGMKHSSNTVRSNMTRFGFSYVGENLAAGTGSNYEVATGGVSSTLAWNSEKQYYTYSTGACTDVCGHYTQAVWAATTHIGCGYARCDSQPYKNYWSCVYGPGGNYQGQKPWAQAASASEYAACQKVGGTSAPGTPAPPTTTVAATPRPSTAAPTPATPQPPTIAPSPSATAVPPASNSKSLPVGTTWQNAAWRGSGSRPTCQNVSLVASSDQMVIIDLFDTPASAIASLKLNGRVVICYYSAGSFEEWRPDAANFTAASKGGKMSGWDELWLKIYDTTGLAEVQRAMAHRLDVAVAKGCDGVEPDNVDCWQNAACIGSAVNATAAKAAQKTYNLWTATTARSKGLLVGLKNDLDQVAELAPSYDFAVNEACMQYNECDMLKPFINANKAVFHTEYAGTPAAVCASRAASSSASAVRSFATKVNDNGQWFTCEALAAAPTPSTSSGGTSIPTTNPPATPAPTPSPPTNAATPSPATSAPSTSNPVRKRKYTVRLNGTSWAQALATSRASVEAAVRADVAARLRISISRVVILSLSVGSLVADVELSSDDVAEPELADTTFVASQLESSSFTSSKAAYVAAGGSASESTLPISVTSSSAAGGGSDGLTCSNGCILVIIVGAIVAVVVIAGVVIGLVCTRRGNQPTRKGKNPA